MDQVYGTKALQAASTVPRGDRAPGWRCWTQPRDKTSANYPNTNIVDPTAQIMDNLYLGRSYWYGTSTDHLILK